MEQEESRNTEGQGKRFPWMKTWREKWKGAEEKKGTWELLDRQAEVWLSGVQARELDTKRSVVSEIQCAEMHTLWKEATPIYTVNN